MMMMMMMMMKMRPVSKEEVIPVLVDACTLGGDDALTNDDITETALEILALPVVREVTA